jgi:chemotaxis protein CheX
MDVRFINPFIKSIKNVFQTMMSQSVEFQKPYVQSSITDRPDVSVVIGYSGDASGAVIMAFRKNVAEAVAGALAGVPMDLDHADFADALGEVANMVAGGAKAEFQGLDVNISLPSVIIGEKHEISHSKVNPSLVIPCETKLGNFLAHVSMKVEKAAAVGVS